MMELFLINTLVLGDVEVILKVYFIQINSIEC